MTVLWRRRALVHSGDSTLSPRQSLILWRSHIGRPPTNTPLLGIAVILILLGAFTSITISIFGFILLFPALLAPSRKPSSKQSPPRPAEQRVERPSWSQLSTQPPEVRTPPGPMPVPVPAPAAAVEMPYVSMSAESTSSSALFPNPILPALSLSIPTTAAPPPSETKRSPPESRDELLEFGVLLAILKVISG